MSEPRSRRKPARVADAAGAPPHFLGHRNRLRERFLAAPDTLPDYELLELLLFVLPQRDMKPLAKTLIDRFGGLSGVLSAEPEALAAVKGMKASGVAALKAVREAALRLKWAELREREVINSWDKLIDYCSAQIAHSKVEEFHLLFLDRKNALVHHERQQRGTVDHTPVYVREVIKRALDLTASALILVHNHPTRPTLITLDHTPSP